ncbi:MAG: ArsR/SmtB family transcription factor [Hyphomicrobium sp.]
MERVAPFSTDALVEALKAAAEPTRLRILFLLQAGELNVKDLTVILGQSQPRISRHLKLLCEAQLIERFREGSWVYFHISERTAGGRLARRLLGEVPGNDAVIARDRDRADTVKREREKSAQEFFEAHAADWDRIRSLHVAEHEVESAIRDLLAETMSGFLVDLGTGTGRMLELLADRYARGLGIDVNQTMLTHARARLGRAGHTHAQVRHGDIYAVSLADGQADAVIMHQVLHFLSDPALAIREAGRLVKPGGRLLIADFAPHGLEFLREREAHERLGFAAAQVTQWMQDAGFKARAVRDLAPVPSANATDEQLTVTIWLGERLAPKDQAPAAKSGRTMENAR